VRFENLKDSGRERFMQVGAGYSVGLRWREIDIVFESRILISMVINSGHIASFLKTREKLCLSVCKLLYRNITILNTIFNGEFILGDKSANKSVSMKNYDLFNLFDLLY